MQGRYDLRLRASESANSSSSVVLAEGEEKDAEFYLDSFSCPILRTPFENPAMAGDGHTYELSAIQEWFSRKRTSPLTGYPVASTATQDNYAMKKAVAEYKEAVIPKLKLLKELEGGQTLEMEALKRLERENIKKEKEIERLKRIEKAFYEQKHTLDNLLRSEQQAKSKIQALEFAFFRRERELEQVKKQLLEKEQELARLKQARRPEPEYARPSCSFAALFSSPNLGGGGRGDAGYRGVNADLVRAVQSGHNRGVVLALDAGANANLRIGLDKATPLILALRLYMTSPEPAKVIIETLCDRGAQVDLGDSRGDRPLHWAAYNNLVWAVSYLLNRRANPLLKNQARETPSEKLLKQRTFKSCIMNRLLRAESRFSSSHEESRRSRLVGYDPSRYEEGSALGQVPDSQANPRYQLNRPGQRRGY